MPCTFAQKSVRAPRIRFGRFFSRHMATPGARPGRGRACFRMARNVTAAGQGPNLTRRRLPLGPTLPPALGFTSSALMLPLLLVDAAPLPLLAGACELLGAAI